MILRVRSWGECSYFIVIDAHSKWPEINEMTNTTKVHNPENNQGVEKDIPYHPPLDGFVQTFKRAKKAGESDALPLHQRLSNFLLSYCTTPHATINGWQEISRHQDGSLSTKVYRKKTHTDKYLNFQSHHPLAHKLAVVRTLFHRADTQSSSVEDQDHEKKHIIRALSRNGYPSRVILHSETGKKTQAQSGGDPPKATVVLPYIRNTSESIRRVLSTVNIRTCFKPHRTLSQVLVHTIDPVPQECRKAVVYRIPCGSCDMSYIGETGRTLQLRIKKHRRALTNGDPCMSALAEHAINNHYNIAWEDTIVVDADPHMYRRRTLEAWHIRQEPNPMNRVRGLLPPVYDSLIRTHPPSDTH